MAGAGDLMGVPENIGQFDLPSTTDPASYRRL